MKRFGFPRTVLTIAALTCLLPLSLTVVLADAAIGAIGRRKSHPVPGPVTQPARKTVLVSGGKMTKALQIARSLHAAGHRVILVESARYAFTAHRASRAVAKFYAITDAHDPRYVDALLAIIVRERVDVYIPVCSPASSRYDAHAKPRLSEFCEVVHVGPDEIEQLDDKSRFAEAARSMDLCVPKSIAVTSAEDVLEYDFAGEKRPFILKSITYDSVRRLDLTKLPLATREQTETFVRSLPISPSNPWVLQEFISGTEYCTHGTFRSGALRVHCCCASSAYQLNYEHTDIAEIEAWASRFGSNLKLTGQASIDFIKANDDGRVYAIECNPRTHSAITLFYNHSEVAQAYLGGELSTEPITPLPSSRPTYWLYYELWRLIRAFPDLGLVAHHIQNIVCGKEAVLDRADPLPFLLLYHWHVPRLLLRDLVERRGWLKIDFNIGKLVQLGGD